MPDLAYTSRRGKSGSKVSGNRALKGKLKYLEYRDDRNGHIPQDEGRERWHDLGMGRHYREILKNCERLGSNRVLAWTWVISPDPTLMALVPEDQREALVASLTEEIVEAYYTERDAEIPSYSYVIHDRLSQPQDIDEPLQHLHSHIVLPGTVPTVEGSNEAFYNWASKGHVQLLHDISTERFEIALDRHVGPEWRALRPELEVLQPTPIQPDDIDLDDDQSETYRWFSRDIS